LYTPLGGSWLNMAESMQRIVFQRGLAGQSPEPSPEIIMALEAVAGLKSEPYSLWSQNGYVHAKRLTSPLLTISLQPDKICKFSGLKNQAQLNGGYKPMKKNKFAKYSILILICISVISNCSFLPTPPTSSLDNPLSITPTSKTIMPQVTLTVPTQTPQISSTPTDTLLKYMVDPIPITGTATENFDPNSCKVTEPWIYLVTLTAPTLVQLSFSPKLWRYSLSNNSYELVPWPFAQEAKLAESFPPECRAEFATHLGVKPDKLWELRALRYPFVIKLSPDGHYLAIGMITWVGGLDYVAPVKSSLVLLDLRTMQFIELWASWNPVFGFKQVLWSPDGNQLAFQVAFYDESYLQVYNLLSHKLISLATPYGKMAWDLDNRHLLLAAADYAPAGRDLLVLDTISQLTHTLNLSATTHLLGSTSGEIRLLQSTAAGQQIYKLDTETEKTVLLTTIPFFPVESACDYNCTAIAYEKTMGVSTDLQILELNSRKIYVVSGINTGHWEWSNSNQVILAIFSQIPDENRWGLICLKHPRLFYLPAPPNLHPYESIIAANW